MKFRQLVPLALILGSFLGAACGKKGPLVLEKTSSPPPISRVLLHQVGETIVISWRFPDTLTDKKTLLSPELLGKVDIFYSDQELPAAKLAQRSNLFIRTDPDQLKVNPEGYFQAIFPLREKKLAGQHHYFLLQYRFAKRKSPPSEVFSMQSLIPAGPVSGLKAEIGRTAIVLSWQAPKSDIKGNPQVRISGYTVYRRFSGTTEEKREFKKITPQPILAASFTDSDVSAPGTYHYSVASLVKPDVESSPSPELIVESLRGFPPETPVSLVIFQAPDHLFLSWNALQEKKFAFYRVYRRRSSSDQFQLLADEIKENYYRDYKLRSGQTFEYAISAVNDHGNESQLSQVAKETFRSN